MLLLLHARACDLITRACSSVSVAARTTLCACQCKLPRPPSAGWRDMIPTRRAFLHVDHLDPLDRRYQLQWQTLGVWIYIVSTRALCPRTSP